MKISTETLFHNSETSTGRKTGFVKVTISDKGSSKLREVLGSFIEFSDSIDLSLIKYDGSFYYFEIELPKADVIDFKSDYTNSKLIIRNYWAHVKMNNERHFQ